MTEKLLLCGFSLPHVMGYLPAKDGTVATPRLTREGLLDYALGKGLAGIEVSLEKTVSSFDGARIETKGETENWHALFTAKNAQIVADYGVLTDFTEAENLASISRAADAGAKTMRFLASHLLCGDRREIGAETWSAKLEAVAQRLERLLPFAEKQGITLAVENHQDLTSDELVYGLWPELERHPAFGVTLDTGNALAVAEDPLAYAEKVAPLVAHVHLKDYQIHFAANGYGLVRCAAGEGCIPFPEIIETIRQARPNATFSLEIAAQSTRTIPVLENSWHRAFADEQIYALPPALRTLWKFGRPIEENFAGSAYERGESSEAIVAEEWACVEKSIAYFAAL